MKIVYRSAYSEDRARDFFKFHLLVRSFSKYIYFGLSTFALVAGAYALLYIDVIYGVVLVFTSSLILIIRPIQAHSIIKKTLDGYPHKNAEFQITFEEDTITYQLELIVKKYRWDELLEVIETNHYWFFYVQKNSALLVSKYQLEQKDRLELMRFLEKNLSEKIYKSYRKK